MHQIYPDEGLVFLAQRAAGISADGLFWQLFENDITPTLDSVLGDFTLIDWDDAIQLDASNLGDVLIVSHVASIVGDILIFANSSGVDKQVYGYVILDPTSTFVVACARFPGAPVDVLNGESQPILPVIGDFSEFINTP